MLKLKPSLSTIRSQFYPSDLTNELIFSRSISGQDKDPTALTPPGRSLSPAMRGFFEVAQTQSVLPFFSFSAVGTLRNLLFSMGYLDTYAHVTTAAQKEAANTMGSVLSGAV